MGNYRNTATVREGGGERVGLMVVVLCVLMDFIIVIHWDVKYGHQRGRGGFFVFLFFGGRPGLSSRKKIIISWFLSMRLINVWGCVTKKSGGVSLTPLAGALWHL